MIASDILTKEQIQYFSKRSDWAAARVLLGNWLLIALIFTIVAVWTNPLTIFLAIILFGGRQLSLAVVVHDCGHRSMFTRWSWNRFAAQWLAGVFVFSDARTYRAKHTKHHRLGGTEEDPDLMNYVNYAVARKSLARKVVRDLTGITGVKIFYYAAKGLGPKAVLQWGGAHLLLFGILYATGHGLLYLMWPAAWLTSHMLIIRLRQAAEHAAVQDLFHPDPRKHTRTTYARWWEKLLIAPNNVNYHLDHHILPSVPCYRLPEFHAFLKENGHLEGAELRHGYWSVFRRLVLPPGVIKEKYAQQLQTDRNLH